MNLSSSDIRIIASVAIVGLAYTYGSLQEKKVYRKISKARKDMQMADAKLYNDGHVYNVTTL